MIDSNSIISLQPLVYYCAAVGTPLLHTLFIAYVHDIPQTFLFPVRLRENFLKYLLHCNVLGTEMSIVKVMFISCSYGYCSWLTFCHQVLEILLF